MRNVCLVENENVERIILVIWAAVSVIIISLVIFKVTCPELEKILFRKTKE